MEETLFSLLIRVHVIDLRNISAVSRRRNIYTNFNSFLIVASEKDYFFDTMLQNTEPCCNKLLRKPLKERILQYANELFIGDFSLKYPVVTKGQRRVF